MLIYKWTGVIIQLEKKQASLCLCVCGEPQRSRRLPVKSKSEFLYKNRTYVLPGKARVLLVGGKITVSSGNKKTANIGKYAVDCVEDTKNISLPITVIGCSVADDYKQILEFLQHNKALDFLNFEYATSNGLTLCTFFKSEQMKTAAALTSRIRSCLPYILNIFKRPLIHLKESEVIQPLDAVKRINHNTFTNLSRHAENWRNIEGDSVVPLKLLTRVYEDDYGIYENIVFRDLINKCVGFLKKRIYSLSEAIEIFNQTVSIDAISMLNHQLYYLSIGKLYAGFFEKGSALEASVLLEGATQVYNQISKNKNRAVYTKNVNAKPIAGEAKRTNILSMHKDYKHIYGLFNEFGKRSVELKRDASAEQQEKSQQAYLGFCQLLLMFAADGFNLKCGKDDVVYAGGRLECTLKYLDFTIELKTKRVKPLDIDSIEITCRHKKNKFRMCLIPISYYVEDRGGTYEQILNRLHTQKTDRFVFLEPFENESGYGYNIRHSKLNLFYAVLPVAISEVNSFRRLQRLLLECMLLSDKRRERCAFCGSELTRQNDGTYLCVRCRTAVKDIECSGCKQVFTVSYIGVKRRISAAEQKRLNDMDEFYTMEKRHLFRGIVDSSENGFICPHCKKENRG